MHDSSWLLSLLFPMRERALETIQELAFRRQDKWPSAIKNDRVYENRSKSLLIRSRAKRYKFVYTFWRENSNNDQNRSASSSEGGYILKSVTSCVSESICPKQFSPWLVDPFMVKIMSPEEEKSPLSHNTKSYLAFFSSKKPKEWKKAQKSVFCFLAKCQTQQTIDDVKAAASGGKTQPQASINISKDAMSRS